MYNVVISEINVISMGKASNLTLGFHPKGFETKSDGSVTFGGKL